MKRRSMQRLRIIAAALEEYSRNERHSTRERTDARIMLERIMLDDLASALNVFHVEPDYSGADREGGQLWQE